MKNQRLAERSAAKIAGRMAWAALAAAAGGVACGDEDPCAQVSFPPASGTVLRVGGRCAVAGGDGSVAKPYATITAALKAAAPGDTVAVAAGTYAEGLTVPPGVNLAGVGADKVRIQPAQTAGVSIKGAGASTISGIGVYNAAGFGIGASDGIDLTLKGVRVEKTQASADGKNPGYGVAASGAKKLTLDGCQVVGSSGVGVVASGTGPVSIIDPLFLKNPMASARGGGAVGIIDPLFMPSSQVTGNQGGGVAIIDPLFAPKGDAASPDLTISATDIAANGKYGVALYGGGAAISRTAIRMTKGNLGDAADGLIVAPRQTANAAAPAQVVKVDELSVLTGNGRAGVLATGAAEVEVGAEVSLSGRGGVWAQGSAAKMRLTSAAHLAQNTMVGVAVTAGATLDFNGGRVSDTKPFAYVPPAGGSKVDLADGVGVFGSAHGSIRGAILKGNPRAGIIGHDCASDKDGNPDLKVENTAISGSKYGVVITGNYNQAAGTNAAASAAPKDKGNSYADVSSEASQDDLPVQDSPCSGNDCSK